MTAAAAPPLMREVPSAAVLRKAGLASPEQRLPVVLSEARVLTRAEGGEDGLVEMIGSTERIARDRGIVRVDGWKLDDYEACGAPFLWCHQQDLPPLGTSARTWVERADRTLRFRIRFAVEAFPFARMIRDLYASRVMRCTSVGFLIRRMQDPTDAEVAQGCRWVSLEQDLLELSSVPVPSDPGAVAVKGAAAAAVRSMVQRGILKSRDAARELAEVAAACMGLRAEDLLLPRASVVAFWREAEEAAAAMVKRDLVDAGETYRAELRPATDFAEGSIADRLVSENPKVAGQVGKLAAGDEAGKLAVHACIFAKADWAKPEDASKWLTDNTDALSKWREEPKEETPEGEKPPPPPPKDEPKPGEKPAEPPPEGGAKPPPPKPPEGEEEDDEEDPEEAKKAAPARFVRAMVDLRESARALATLADTLAREAAPLLQVDAAAAGGASASDVELALGEPGGKQAHGAAKDTALRAMARVVDRLSTFQRETVAKAAADAAGTAVRTVLEPFLPALEALRKRLAAPVLPPAPPAAPPAAPTRAPAKPNGSGNGRAPLYRGAPVLGKRDDTSSALNPELVRAVLPTT